MSYTKQMHDVILTSCNEAVDALGRIDWAIRAEHERKAEDRAIDSGLGISEWESFMPPEWHDLQRVRADLCALLARLTLPA